MTDTDTLAPAAAGGATPPAFQPAPGKPTTAQALQQLADQQAAILAALPHLANVLPQLTAQALAQALASVLQQVPVQTRQHLCCHCLTARVNWEALHQRELNQAMEAAAVAAEIPEGDPRRAQLDVVPYLPEGLRPGAGPMGMPPMNVAVTTVNGTEVCPVHLPGRAGGSTLLVATATMSRASLAGLG